MNASLVETLAEKLDTALRTRVPIPPISESDGVSDVKTAYAVQSRWTSMRLERGEKLAARSAHQSHPAAAGGANRTTGPCGVQLSRLGRQVKIRGDSSAATKGVAFLIGKPLLGPVSRPAVLDAASLRHGMSRQRIADWRIKRPPSPTTPVRFHLGPRPANADPICDWSGDQHNGTRRRGMGSVAPPPGRFDCLAGQQTAQFGVSSNRNIVISGHHENAPRQGR
jgi:hypothetical protein